MSRSAFPSPRQSPAKRIQAALDLLERLEQQGGVRELMALSVQIDTWLSYESPIALPDGGTWPEAGQAFHSEGELSWWLLPGGRVLEVDGTGATEAREIPILELDVDAAALAGHLRPRVIEGFVGQPLSSLEGPTLPRTVAALLSAAWGTGSLGRQAVLEQLAEACAHRPGWDEAAARLQAGFERSLGDVSPGVRQAAVKGLLKIALGQAPGPPNRDPTRLVNVVLGMPRADVKASALRWLLTQPDAALEPVRDRLSPILTELIAEAEPELRQLASEMQLHLTGQGRAHAISRDLGSEDSRLREQALRRIDEDEEDHFSILMPKVMDSIQDEDPSVRDAALRVLMPQLEAAPRSVERRLMVALLSASDPRAVTAGLRYAEHRVDDLELSEDPEILAALRDALDGLEEIRAELGRVWLRFHRDRDAEALGEAIRTLLQHPDPVLRQTALRGIAADPTDRKLVKDAILAFLVERLQDEESSLRLDAAKAIAALDYPHAAEIASQLAFDGDAFVRRSALQLVEGIGDAGVTGQMRDRVSQADRLLDRETMRGEADDRAWQVALEALQRDGSSRVPALLRLALSRMPAHSRDPRERRAVEALDQALLARSEDAEDLLAQCRKLMEPPSSRPEHAIRLAGHIANREPRALDFIWTCYRSAGGSTSRSAARALEALAPRSKTEPVKAEIHALSVRETDSKALRLLARLSGQPRPSRR